MKSLARSYLWWPGLDKALEDCVHRYLPCQSVQNVPAVAPLHPWLWPARPWQRVHLDFAGPFLGHMFMIMVDAHSKWPEIVEMSSTTTKQTIAVLNKVFAAYGLPEQVVSDNGRQFISDEFQLFMKSNGIKHIRCSPYHPSSNGLAERMVQTFKKAMKASANEATSVSQKLSDFLLSYRSIPHSTTNETPGKLFLGRNIRTRLDLLLPDIHKQVTNQQARQKTAHDQKSTA